MGKEKLSLIRLNSVSWDFELSGLMTLGEGCLVGSAGEHVPLDPRILDWRPAFECKDYLKINLKKQKKKEDNGRKGLQILFVFWILCS